MATYAGKTYTNGNVPKSLLAPLDGENYGNAELRRDAAESWNRARAEVKAKTGVVLAVRGWNRTYDEQVTFYLQRHERWTPGYKVCCYWNGVPYRFTGTAHAAPPGTSNHGWGLAVDIVDFGGVGQWNNPRYLAAWPILAKHGWTETEGRGSIQEPWHKVYDPAKDQRKNTTPTQEDDMTPAQADQLDDLHRLLLRKFTDGDQTIDIVDGVRRDLIVDRRTEADVESLVAANRAQSAAIETLAKSVGIDPEIVTAAVEKAVREALPTSVTIPLEG